MSVHARKDAIIHHTKLMMEDVARMDERSESFQAWLDWRNFEAGKKEKLDDLLGSSWGVKFQLEKSWT
eukprot:2783176-Rhodomonas_salina.1